MGSLKNEIIENEQEEQTTGEDHEQIFEKDIWTLDLFNTVGEGDVGFIGY